MPLDTMLRHSGCLGLPLRTWSAPKRAKVQEPHVRGSTAGMGYGQAALGGAVVVWWCAAMMGCTGASSSTDPGEGPTSGGDGVTSGDDVGTTGGTATDVDEADVGDAMAEPVELRVATFNVALSDFEAVGDLAKALEAGSDKGRKVAEIIQRVRPDVLLINEFDRDTSGEALDRWRSDYLGVGQAGQEPIAYPHTYTPDCNTGRLADADLSGDGQIKLPEDGYGFGNYDGQYCMVLLSRYPIESASVRTWQNLLWRDLSGNMLPTDHYSESAQAVFRLSSKTHADVPVVIGETVLHMLISHPTPPVFDGPEDRNGRRNFDEIRLWADLLTPDPGEQLVDDAGNRGGLGAEALFVIAGDQNADPDKGDSVDGAIAQLLDHPRVNATTVPLGGNGSSETSSFGLRVDYVLPSSNLTVKGSGVFAPAADDPLAALATASDHRLVWVDLVVEPH